MSDPLAVGDVTLDVRTLTGPLGKANLTPLETKLLSVLMKAPNKSVSYDHIIFAMYDSEGEPDSARNIVHIMAVKIRKKLLSIGVDRFLGSVWGHGLIVRGQARHPLVCDSIDEYRAARAARDSFIAAKSVPSLAALSAAVAR